MPKLESILPLINAELETKLFNTRRFQGGKLYDNIARSLSTQENEAATVRPVITDNDGQATPMDINDAKPFILYHHIVGLAHEDSSEEEFGEPGTGIKETADINLIFAGDRRVLEVIPEDVGAGIYAFLLRQLPHATLQSLSLLSYSLIPSSVETDMQKVMAQEYQGIEFIVDPSFIYISVNYKLITIYSKSCFSLC